MIPKLLAVGATCYSRVLDADVHDQLRTTRSVFSTGVCPYACFFRERLG